MRKTTSYQRRTGRLSNNQKAHLSQSAFLLEDDHIESQIIKHGSFQKYVLEIGFGMGEHLLTNTINQPETLFIGIDLYKPGIAALLCRIHEEAINNCLLIEGDASEKILTFGQIRFDRIDIHHPDPWPKKRHHKRKLLNLEFISQVVEQLCLDGTLQIITDDIAYYEHIEAICEQLKSDNLQLSTQKNRKANSKYGRKAIAEGRQINSIELKKTAKSEKLEKII